MAKKSRLLTARRTQEKLEWRLRNLEMMAHKQWQILRDALPPAHAATIDELMLEHYQASAALGGLPKISRADIDEQENNADTTEEKP